MKRVESIAVLAEITEALSRYGHLRCAPRIDEEDGLLTVSVTLQAASGHEALEILSLADELRYVADVATMRHFAEKYGIDPSQLESLLGQRRVGP